MNIVDVFVVIFFVVLLVRVSFVVKVIINKGGDIRGYGYGEV